MSHERLTEAELRARMKEWNESGDWWLFALPTIASWERATTLIAEFYPEETAPVCVVRMPNMLLCRAVLACHKSRLSPPELARWFGVPERDEEFIPVTILALGRGMGDVGAMGAAIELKGWIDGELTY